MGSSERKQFPLIYNNSDGTQTNIPIFKGDVLFILGPNGSGKSALMQQVYIQNQSNAVRITAQRQMWFHSNLVDLTPSSKAQTEQQIRSYDSAVNSRYMDNVGMRRFQVLIYKLIAADNSRNREIANALSDDDVEKAKELACIEATTKQLNNILKIANLPFQILIHNDEKIIAKKEGYAPYSIAELSDGERNAVLIAAEILTAPNEALIVIDEPERHLHRSIVSPLLSELFDFRDDCTFVIATHDLGLPIDNPTANVLLVRSCSWQGNDIATLDTDLISAKDNIADDIKYSILGSRRTLVFVEGNKSSLDAQIYEELFPFATVIPMGSCIEVEKAVKGIRQTMSLNWVNAFGLIDADDRTPEELNNLEAEKIYSLPTYSVEYLYYQQYVLGSIAEKQESIIGGSVVQYMSDINSAILNILESHKQRLCARVCERETIANIKLPTWKDLVGDTPFEIEDIDVKNILSREENKFDDYVSNTEYDKLLGRYPVRETELLSEISKILGFRDKDNYEKAVIKLIQDQDDVRETIKNGLGTIAIELEKHQ